MSSTLARPVGGLAVFVLLAGLACAPPSSGTGGAGGSGGGGYGNNWDASSSNSDGRTAATCKKMDMVFAIDTSGSMSEEQRVMGKVIFPAFALKLRSLTRDLKDYRVGVLDSCANPASFHTIGRGGECNFWGGKPWIESASPTMVSEFACVGEILKHTCYVPRGAEDSAEQPASAAASSLEPAWAGPGRPNEGFLRKDAVLVILAMTDEDEQPQETAMQVYTRLLALKENAKHLVFLGIAGSKSCVGPYGSAQDAIKMKEVVKLFEANGRGFFWDLCAGSLEEGLEAALRSVKVACEQFTV